MEEHNPPDKKEIKPIAVAIKETIVRDIGQYGGTHGLDKFHHLTNVIYHLLAHLKVDFVSLSFNREMERLKKFEEKTGNKTPYSLIKDWNSMFSILEKTRPHIDEIKFEYDKIRKNSTLKDSEKKMSRKAVVKKFYKKVSPYSFEIYFLFNFLMEISGFQAVTIPAQAWQSPDTTAMIRTLPIKQKHLSTRIQGSSESGEIWK